LLFAQITAGVGCFVIPFSETSNALAYVFLAMDIHCSMSSRPDDWQLIGRWMNEGILSDSSTLLQFIDDDSSILLL